jgi:hypothetical protein
MVHCLLKIREEIEKLASGHISQRKPLRLEKSRFSTAFFRNYFRPEANLGADTFKLGFDGPAQPEAWRGRRRGIGRLILSDSAF